MNSKDKGKISRSTGVMIHPGYIVGGGFQGVTKALDEVVAKEAEILRDHFGADVTIRFNSHRRSGGAWLIDSPQESVGSNSSIGLGAKLVNSKLRNLRLEEVLSISKNERDRLAQEPDTIIYTTAIDLIRTEHSVSPDSKYILTDSEYRDFDSLTDACEYLFSHVAGMK